MKRTIIFASMAIASGLALANIYTSVVDVPAWGHHIPESIVTTRKYYEASNPGNFFRIFSPINQLLGLLCVLFFWEHGIKVRSLLVAAFILYVIGEGMTFMYFYPRNDIMFTSNLADVEKLKLTWHQWQGMNWMRTLVIAAGVVCSSAALHFSYIQKWTDHKILKTSNARERILVEQ